MVGLGEPALGLGVSAVHLGLAHPLHTDPGSFWALSFSIGEMGLAVVSAGFLGALGPFELGCWWLG